MHSLIVGGTGMLRGVTLHLVARATTVSLLARQPEKIGSLEGINPVAVDYGDDLALAKSLRSAIALQGPIDLAVCTVDQGEAPLALSIIAHELALPGDPFRLFHVRGSRAADPAQAPRSGLDPTPVNCLYRQVVLGWMTEGETTRWLKHDEICAGVIRAIERDEERAIVGSVRPWHMRPGY